MSTREDREWDAYRDAHTVHGDCGRTLDRCDCDDPDPDILPDPDSLDRRAARMWARACTLVATTIREELGHASSTRVAEDLEQRARCYADRAEGAA